jgi:hypothetical protein
MEDPDDQHIDFVRREWLPVLREQRSKAVLTFRTLPASKRDERAWQEIQGQFGAPDSHWDWKKKREAMLGSVNRMFALVDGQSVEGLMRLDLSRFSSIAVGAPVVYVEFLAVAPWNRSVIQKPRFRGIGTLLLGVAVSVSLEEEMEGRCGLHSLLQSEGFYRRVGMKDLGIVDSSGLRYFEFEPDAAKNFLKG